MTVKELIKELKNYPQDAEVYINQDWDVTDDEGHFTELAHISGVCDDVLVVDMGMDWVDEHRIIIDV